MHDKKFLKVEVTVAFPKTLTSDEAFDDWMRSLDKLVTSKGCWPAYSKLLSVHTTDPTENENDGDTRS